VEDFTGEGLHEYWAYDPLSFEDPSFLTSGLIDLFIGVFLVLRFHLRFSFAFIR
jgi:hypothetical protein